MEETTESKIERIKNNFSAWEKNQKLYRGFFVTDGTSPSIYWLPKYLSDTLQDALDTRQAKVRD